MSITRIQNRIMMQHLLSSAGKMGKWGKILFVCVSQSLDVSYDFLNLVRELRSYRSISTPDMDKPFELRIIFASFCGHRSSSGSKHFFTNAYQVGRQIFVCVSQRDSCFDKCIYIFNTTEHRHKATCLLVRCLAASHPFSTNCLIATQTKKHGIHVSTRKGLDPTKLKEAFPLKQISKRGLMLKE